MQGESTDRATQSTGSSLCSWLARPLALIPLKKGWLCFWGKAAEGVGAFAEVSKLYLLLLPQGRVGPEVWRGNWGFSAFIPPHGALPCFPGSAVPSSPTQFRPLSCFIRECSTTYNHSNHNMNIPRTQHRKKFWFNWGKVIFLIMYNLLVGIYFMTAL